MLHKISTLPARRIRHLSFKIIYSLPHNKRKTESAEILKNDKTTVEGKINTRPSHSGSYVPSVNS